MSLRFRQINLLLGPLAQTAQGLVEIGVALVLFEVIFKFFQVELRLFIHFVVKAGVLQNFRLNLCDVVLGDVGEPLLLVRVLLLLELAGEQACSFADIFLLLPLLFVFLGGSLRLVTFFVFYIEYLFVHGYFLFFLGGEALVLLYKIV